MSTLGLLSLIVTAAALFAFLSVRVLRVPITIGTMLLAVVGSLLLVPISHAFPAAPAAAQALVDRIHFSDLILHGMLSLLLFAGAFLLDLIDLAREKLAVTLLAVLGTIFSVAAVSAAMHALLPALGIPAPWIECLFFGALISPTDPVAVLEMLHRVGVGRSIRAQLAGESLFNDGIGAVIFLAVLDASRGEAPSLRKMGLRLLLQSGGGMALGILLARIASEFMRHVRAYQVDILLTLALALGGYALADGLNISGPLEAVTAGLALRYFNRGHMHGEIDHDSVDRFWTVIDEVQNALLFVMLGAQVLAIRFPSRALVSGAAAIVTVIAVRLLVVGLVVRLLRAIQPGHQSSVLTLAWGGLRGGLSIALALAIPQALSQNWIIATTYLVVVFSIVVQGGTLDMFLKRSGSPPSEPALRLGPARTATNHSRIDHSKR